MSALRASAMFVATMSLTLAGFVTAVPAMRVAGFDQKSGTVAARPGAPLGIGLALNLLILVGALWIFRRFTARLVADMGPRGPQPRQRLPAHDWPRVTFTATGKPLSERTRLIYYTVLSALVALIAVLWCARPA